MPLHTFIGVFEVAFDVTLFESGSKIADGRPSFLDNICDDGAFVGPCIG
jgi:hypothetical protein